MKSVPRRRKVPTILDVARRAGVSPMTVSRVINGGPSVRPATAALVRAAIAALQFAPNPAARSLASGRRLRFGLVHSNPSASYLSELLVGALQAASVCDVHLVVETSAVAADPNALIDHLLRGGVNGLLIPPPLCDAREVIERVVETGLFAVAIASGNAPPGGWAITIDDRAAAREMVAHLVALGHRRIGFIRGSPDQSASELRMAGYLDGLASAGIAEDPALVAQGYFTYRSGLDAAEQLMSLPDEPTAIFAANDDMAAAVVATAHRGQLDVPGSLSVCGFDDTALATAIWPELTTIRQPVAEMAYRAVTLLARAARGERPPSEIIKVEHVLIRRQSDAVPRRRPVA